MTMVAYPRASPLLCPSTANEVRRSAARPCGRRGKAHLNYGYVG